MQSSRRKFIAQLGAIGASTGLAGIANAAPNDEIQKKKCTHILYSLHSSNHRRTLSNSCA